ncbi:MAG: metallophosphoesterase family protein [Bacteroidota bacterium]|nr:metallophosphoesterase [Kiloniellaceae bacterium]
MFTLAHISDPHLGPLPPVRPSELMNKRFFGWLSWVRRRRALHRPEVLAALAADLAGVAPDHLVITGDLTNIALPGEFALVGRWLESLGAPEAVSVVPGNHDAYVAVPWETSLAKWSAFMACEEAGTAAAGPEAFPYVRRRGPAAIIGLSSAQPTPLFQAHGTLGQAQLERLDAVLRRLGKEGRFRVVLLHHPPSLEKVVWRKRLVDAQAFRAVIADAGAELILHGHDHTFGSETIPGPGGPVPVVGVPSASAGRGGGRHPIAHYQLYRIEKAGNTWRIEVAARGFDAASGAFGEVRSYAIL